MTTNKEFEQAMIEIAEEVGRRLGEVIFTEPTKLIIRPVDLTRALKVMNGKKDNKNEPQT